MSRTSRGLVLAAALSVAVAMLPAEAADRGDTLALRFAGRLQNQSTDPTHFVFTGELRSLATGEVVGSMTHDVTCATTAPPPCAVLDAVNTFRLADGELVNHAFESLAPDPQHPDHLLVGNHPPGRSIVSGAGAYAGRTGRAHMSARHDVSELPAYATFDDFWLIELDPE